VSSHLDIIRTAIDSTSGEIWECGVYSGDTAHWMAGHAPLRTLRLFDTFSGMPISGPHDSHKVGVMWVDEQAVRARFTGFPNTSFHPGIIPVTFSGFEAAQVGVTNIDVDQYDSVKACLEFIYPRMEKGGYIILDDYNCPDCPGAKLATDEFMVGKPERLVKDGDCQPYLIKT